MSENSSHLASLFFRVAIVGKSEREEFRGLVTSLTQEVRADFCDDLSSIGLSDYGLMLLLQSYPGEFAEKDFVQVRVRSPLCRFVLVAGSLCVGEKRTGSVVEGVFRYYVFQYQQLQDDLLQFLTRKKSLLAQPATLSDDETVMGQSLGVLSCLRKIASWKKRASIHSFDADMREYLNDLCRSEGFHAVSDTESPDLVILDIPEQALEESQKTVERFRSASPGSQIFLLYDSPRHAEMTALLKSGADHLFAKPFL